MATLVLSAVGGIVGGPVGAAIGGLLGQAVDREVLFRPKGREGPRLTDLRVQTSSYGTPLAQVFGTMRVAGCVIWATDLIESRSTSRSGKGQPSVTSYSYAASFAVALSARPIVGVGRIWADGKLLRGSAGDFKTQTGFRLHGGDEDQPVDPLIASAEGLGQAPAHRGIAYAVFEQLQLADFGNRIPSLTFEVIADAAPPAAGGIAAVVAPEVRRPEGSGAAVAGFVAAGEDVRTVLTTLATLSGAHYRPAGSALEMRFGTAVERDVADLGTSARGAARPGERRIATVDAVPTALTVAHYDPARDYQTGLQRVRRPGPGAREQRVEVPAALSAGEAKALAAARLAEAETGRARRTFRLGWDALDIAPGTTIAVPGEGERWRVTEATFEEHVVTLVCERAGAAVAATGGSSGRAVVADDAAIGATLLEVFELPPLDAALPDVPQLAIAATGQGAGWRRAALLLSTDRGGSWQPVSGGSAAPAVIGTVAVPTGPAAGELVDRRSLVEVELAHAGLELGDADDAALDAGANLALIGEELVQFARAEPLSPTRWRLTGLRRGRRGTEAAGVGHGAGERFVLIERDTLVLAALPAGLVGGEVRVMASGAGDLAGPVERRRTVTGAAIVPPAPVRLRAAPAASGGWRIDWVRRSRRGWDWLDGSDAPLVEEAERYLVTHN